MRPTNSRDPIWILAVSLWLVSCAAKLATPEMPLTPPPKVCDNPKLNKKSFCLPKDAETMLRTGKFDILDVRKPSSGLGGSQIFFLKYPADGTVIKAKWKTAPKGGDGFNNEPRKELAVHKMEELFLEPDEYVVPPTVGRCIKTATIHEKVPKAEETFDGAPCVYGVLAYWLTNVTPDGVYDMARFDKDPEYRKSVAKMNLLTYLIDHRDTRKSNFLISTDKAHPRTFAVDNGLAFSGFRNPIVAFTKINWARIIVPSLPREQLDRLRKLTRKDLDTLLTVAQYHVTPTGLEEVDPTAAFSDSEGVRRQGDMIQLGLTRHEVDGIESRLKTLLERVDRGKIQVF